MKEDLNTPLYSYWPLFLALSVVLIAIGIVWTIVISVLGLLLLFASVIGWVGENRTEAQEDN